MKRRLLAFFYAGVLGAAVTMQAQEGDSGLGRISGQVVDAATGEVITGASIALLEDPTFYERTDLNGSYRFSDVFTGTYTVRVFKGGYEPQDVKGVRVTGGEVTRLDIPLPRREDEKAKTVTPEVTTAEDGTDIFELAAFEVTAEVIQSTEATLLKSRQRSISIGDAIGGEAFSRLGLGDAAEAMSKVTGASVVDGKYVYIRGLGDRYSNTLLNGASIPSADPDRQAVQMDQFPSDLLESISTSKSFTPDQPGSFSGGSVNIQTKSFPDHFFLKTGASLSINSQTTGEFIYRSAEGVNWTADGVNDRPRTQVPSDEIPVLSGRATSTAVGAAIAGDLSVAEKIGSVTREFTRRFYPIKAEAGPAYSFNGSIGDTLVFKNDRKFGYTASLTWDRDYHHYRNGIEARWQTPDSFKDSAQVYTTDPEVLGRLRWYREYWGVLDDPYGGDVPFGVTRSIASVNWGAFAKLAFLAGTNHELSFTMFHNQSAEDEVKHGVGDGFNSSLSGDTLFEAVSILYTERGMTSGQIHGRHLLNSLNDLEVKWQASQTESTQDQPDYRTLFTAWDYEEQRYRRVNTSDLDPPVRRYRDMVEDNEEYKVDFSLPVLEKSKIKWGALMSDANRDYNEITYSVSPLTWQGQPDTALVEGIYTDPYLGFDFEKVIPIDRNGDGEIDTYNLIPALEGRHFIERGIEGNNYIADGSVEALYLMGDFAIAEKWRMITGVRYETNAMNVLQILEQQGVDNREGGFEEKDFLPALSLVYAINERQNLRLAYGRTIAKPTFKELSPVVIVDSFTGDRFQGNPDLTRTVIDNFDVRWEWFIEGLEMVAVSAFYKQMKDPIEVLFFGGADTNGDGVIDNNDIQPFQRGNIVPQNVDEATVYGLEFEARYGLGRLSERFSNFSVGGNLSLIESEVSVPADEQLFFSSEGTRQLVGQSPVLVNFDLSYDNDNWGTYLNLSYNFTGERLSVVNPNNSGLGNVFEKSRGSLNLYYTQRLNGNMKLKIGLENLLDPAYEKFYDVADGDNIVYESYTRGITGSISLSYTFE
ncbi:MAG: TonB-dependent receptor [Puniceicoccaceae bacterium]